MALNATQSPGDSLKKIKTDGTDDTFKMKFG